MKPTLKLIARTGADSWSEEDIKALAVDNPQAAMEVVVQKYRERLFYHALYIVKDWEEAYDAIQEVFIRAMREKRFFNEDFRIKAWLYRVTSNLCFNLIRNHKRRGAILESVPHEDTSAPDQIEQVFAGERQVEMMQAIDQMSQDHREILLLRYYNDLSYAEISETLNIKLGTVMSRLSRARSRLLEIMETRPELLCVS
jgi:RNA polymerase sigma-70 factor (ECF subfamily)